jgi:ATP-dependent HslUV protease subunit HslV
MKDRQIRSTTILSVRKDDRVAIGGDGQVTLKETVLKHTAVKIRSLYNDNVLVGFAGATADALTLLEKFEAKLEEYGGRVDKAAIELAKMWRTDKYLRNLQALLNVAGKEDSLLVSGNGDVISPDDGVIGIGSGGDYAVAAARGMLRCSDLSAEEIVRNSLEIASEICVYTNSNIVVKVLET